MNLIFGLVGLFVHFIFLQKRELLYQKKSFILILLACVALFVLTFILMSAHIGNPKMIKLLTFPLSALIIFCLMRLIYFKIYDKNPEDTFWSMDASQMRDGIFNFLFWVVGIILPAVFAYKVLP